MSGCMSVLRSGPLVKSLHQPADVLERRGPWAMEGAVVCPTSPPTFPSLITRPYSGADSRPWRSPRKYGRPIFETWAYTMRTPDNSSSFLRLQSHGSSLFHPARDPRGLCREWGPFLVSSPYRWSPALPIFVHWELVPF